MRRLFARLDRWLEPSPEVEADTAFAEFTGRLTLRYVQIVSLVVAASALLWWPTDPWLFRGNPNAVAVFATTRPLIAAISTATVFGCRALRHRPRLGLWLVTAAAAAQAFIAGWFYSRLGGLGQAWFYFAYFFPFTTLIVLTGPRSRAAITAIISSAYPLAYFLRSPAYVNDERFGITVSFLVFVAITAAITGHVIYRLIERNFHAQQELERRVAERTRALSRLTGHLATRQERERARVARDLHDDMGQLLTAMRLELEIAHLAKNPAELADAHARLHRLIDDGFRAYRSIVESLRPRILDDRGLAAALSWSCDQIARRAGLAVTCTVDGDDDDVDGGVAVAVFRIVQEALTNVVRHARAHAVRVEVRIRDGTLSLQIEDDGAGFDPDAAIERGFGLLGMRERVRAAGGELTLRSAPQRGSRLTVAVPARGARAGEDDGADAGADSERERGAD